jgi:hypothetical protein
MVMVGVFFCVCVCVCGKYAGIYGVAKFRCSFELYFKSLLYVSPVLGWHTYFAFSNKIYYL